LERFVLVGHFSSSRQAIAYAVRHSERVTHLVLRDPTMSAADQAAIIPGVAIINAVLPLTASHWELVSLNAAAIGFAFSDLNLAGEFARAIRSGLTPEAFQAQHRSLDAIDASPLLGSIQVPTLVVADASFPGRSGGTASLWSGYMRKIAAAIPDARFETTSDFASATDAFVRGDENRAPQVESGSSRTLQTVLFTDLVGHTEMMSRLGDERGRDVLREHERITREVLKAHGGTEVKTMGDGFMASFGSVTKAVECAVALQRAFAEREGEPLSVRVGLNAGEPIEEDGDLFGATVILASRIAAKADAGEILVADTVRGLCSGKGFLFADRGEFVAKGFEEPVRVSEVSWTGR
jgi:class 3 adenylate cyclase